MNIAFLAHPADVDGWRASARAFVAAGIPPSGIVWQVTGEGAGDLLGGLGDGALPTPTQPSFAVPKRFLNIAEVVACHRDPERWALLYTTLTRLRTEPKLLADAADPLVHRLSQMARSVGRDLHKMRAFVRFRELAEAEGARFVAWFEPNHHIVRLNSGFFVRRFAQMRWSILTPELCAHWEPAQEDLAFTPGAIRADAPAGDPLEDTWKTYYASIFNPARLKVKMMTKEVPKKYWRNMPETALIAELIAGAGTRTTAMIDADQERRMEPTPDTEAPAEELAAIAADASACTRCELYKPATQTVFGEGPSTARLMFVGEQPGDQEDLAGKPFVGPAGQVFNRALAAAGIAREQAYVTNAVKHFKFEQRGKRRIHSKPGTGEIDACRWWLDRERALVKPLVTVALGATAARGLTGRAVTIGKERGRPLTLADGTEAWITVHPSFLLRIEDAAAAGMEFSRFVEDLRAVRARLVELGA